MEKAHGAAAYELLDKGPELLILNVSSGADLALGHNVDGREAGDSELLHAPGAGKDLKKERAF